MQYYRSSETVVYLWTPCAIRMLYSYHYNCNNAAHKKAHSELRWYYRCYQKSVLHTVFKHLSLTKFPPTIA